MFGLVQQLLVVSLDEFAVQQEPFVVLREYPAVKCVLEPRRGRSAGFFHVDVLREGDAVQFLRVKYNAAFLLLIRHITQAKRVFDPKFNCGLRRVLYHIFPLIIFVKNELFLTNIKRLLSV